MWRCQCSHSSHSTHTHLFTSPIVTVYYSYTFSHQAFPQLLLTIDSTPPTGLLLRTRKPVLALDLEGVHDVKLHHPSSSVATSNQ